MAGSPPVAKSMPPERIEAGGRPQSLAGGIQGTTSPAQVLSSITLSGLSQ